MLKNLTFEKVVKLLLAIGALWAAGFLLLNFLNLVVYVVIAMLFAYLLDPIVNRMQAAGLNRTLSIVVTLTSVILILVWVSTTIFPIVANQMGILARQLNVDNIRFILDQVEELVTSNLDFIQSGYIVESITMVLEDTFNLDKLTDVMGGLIGVFTNLFSAILVIPFALFFFLKDGFKIRRNLLRFVPNAYFETTLSLIDKIETRLGFYFRSVFIQCTIVGIVSWLTLSLAGLNNAVSVGVTIGVANSIPYFGPIIGYILSIVVSIIETGNFSLVIPCILAVLVAQVLDNAVLQPLIFSRSADMHPLAILFIILIGAQTAGLLGMLIAIPLATIIKISINQISWSYNNYYIFRAKSSSISKSKSSPSSNQPVE